MANLIIYGMHRSRTSVLAQWLQMCGLFLGDDLLGPGPINTDGHFEDLSFLAINKDILDENKKDYFLESCPQLQVSTFLEKRSKELVRHRQNRKTDWGWKDPRNSILLEFWQSILGDEAKFIGIFRPYEEVVASLEERLQYSQGRKERLLSQLPIIGQVRASKRNQKLLMSWLCYNQKILDFWKMNSSKTLIFSIDSYLDFDKEILSYMNRLWQCQLNYIPFKEIYKERTALHKKSKPIISNDLLAKADSITKALEEIEVKCLEKVTN